MVGVYDVRAYGAVGDGSANDTTAIQNAINAAAAGGGSVTFDRGIFKITQPLQINASNVHLLGLGAAASVIKVDFIASTTPVIAIGGTGIASRAENISLRKLTFVNQNPAPSNGPLFSVFSARNVTIADCAVGPGQYGTFSQIALLGRTETPNPNYPVDSVLEFYFLNNQVKTDSAGVPRNSSNLHNAIQLHSGSIAVIRDCMFNNRKPSAYAPTPADYVEAVISQDTLERNWDGLVVSGCTFEDYPRLVKVVGAGMANVRISDNIADGSAWATIYVGAAGAGNSGASWNWMIADNVFDGEATVVNGQTTLWTDGMGIRLSEALGGQVRNVTITGNVLRAYKGSGIHVDYNVAGVAITGNTLQNVAQASPTSPTAAIKIGNGTTAVTVTGNSILTETIPGFTPVTMTAGIEWQGTGTGRAQAGNAIAGAASAQVGTP